MNVACNRIEIVRIIRKKWYENL